MFSWSHKPFAIRILRLWVILAVTANGFPVQAASSGYGSAIQDQKASVRFESSTPAILVLQPDGFAGQDTFIYSGSKNANQGLATDMGIGEDSSANNRVARTLIRFNLASIPPEASVVSATLSLWTSADLSSNTRTVRVYRLKVPFNESQATWNIAAAGQGWQVSGAAGANDRESTAIGSVSILSNESLGLEKQIALNPASIQEMIAGTFPNHGFLLAADTESNDRFNYRTSDSSAASQRPKLVVQYMLPTSTATLTPSATPTYSLTPSATLEPSPTPTRTLTPSSTASETPFPSATPSPTSTSTEIPTATLTPSPGPTTTPYHSETASALPTSTDVPTGTLIPSPTASETLAPSSTPGIIFTSTQTPTPIPLPSETPPPSATLTPTALPLPTLTPSETPTLVDSGTPSPTSTATEQPTATPTSSVPPMGPLAASPVNPRYFSEPGGRMVYLTGSHTWCDFMDCGNSDPILTPFDYTAYLDFLAAHNHNFFRLWRAENARGGEAGPDFWFDPMPYQRSEVCCAFDGGNKFDLTRFNQAYFDRMRARIIAARQRGIYVSVMLFDGWSVESKIGNHEPWAGHPYNLSNNINNIDGDTNNDNQGGETHTLSSAEITSLQEAYVRKVIATVNDLDNVLYEISNESTASTANNDWQYHLIQYVKSYEAGLPQQHPVGMTYQWPGGSNTSLFSSPADWISLGGGVDINTYVPPVADGSKVIIADTDHLCGICGTRQWVWKSFTRGENPVFMDVYDPATTSRGMYLEPTGNEATIRASLGYTRSYASRMNLAAMTPQPALCSSGYCLVSTAGEAELLVYMATGGTFTVDLRAISGALSVEWFNPSTGIYINQGTVEGGANRVFSAPFSGDAVLYLKSVSGSNPTATVTETSWPATFTASPTDSAPATSTLLATSTAIPIFTRTDTPASTNSPTWTPVPTLAFTPTVTKTLTPTFTSTPPGSFPLNPILDTFNRSNGNVGNSWSGYTRAFAIASGQLDVTSSGWNTYLFWNGTSFGADQEAYLTLAQIDSASSNEQSLILKSQSSTSTSAGMIYVMYDGAGRSVQVWTYHPSQSWVQYGASIPVTLINGDQLGVHARAEGIVEIYRNGTLLATRNITAWPYYASGGYIGLWFVNAPGAQIDNFGGGTR